MLALHDAPDDRLPADAAVLIADLHGDQRRLRTLSRRLADHPGPRVLLGDSGFALVPDEPDWGSLSLRPWPRDVGSPDAPWCLVPGNHDDYRVLRPQSPHALPPGLTWWPRGERRVLAGWDVIAIGGAESHPAQRHEGRDWWPDHERVPLALIETILATQTAPDLLLFHCPPASYYRARGSQGRVPRSSQHLQLLCDAWAHVPWIAAHDHQGGQYQTRGLVVARHDTWALLPKPPAPRAVALARLSAEAAG